MCLHEDDVELEEPTGADEVEGDGEGVAQGEEDGGYDREGVLIDVGVDGRWEGVGEDEEAMSRGQHGARLKMDILVLVCPPKKNHRGGQCAH